MIYFFFIFTLCAILLQKDPCNNKKFVNDEYRESIGLSPIGDPYKINYQKRHIFLSYTRDTTLSDRTLRLQDSYYEPFKSGKTIIKYDPYKKYKLIEIDTNNCSIRKERDKYIKPIKENLYESFYINKMYSGNGLLKLDSLDIRYRIELLKPSVQFSGLIKFEHLEIGERPKWWYYNKDSLFTDNHYKNDSIFSKVISRSRVQGFPISIKEADSLLSAWGLGKYRGDIPKREP